MPRIPSDELERLKHDISLERLAEARGVALLKKGKDLHGRCPFHEDRTPSLVIDTQANLWHCFGACNSGGSVVDWVMRDRAVSFRHAIEILRYDLPTIFSAPPTSATKRTTVRVLPPAVNATADDRALLAQVVGYYHRKLKESPAALAYLDKRGLSAPGLVDHFRLGFSDRTLGLTIPDNGRKAGAELRERLTRIGILNAETGHELYRGMLTIPTFDLNGQVVGLYGRRASESMRETATKHRNLTGALSGVLNLAAFAASEELILCEAALDAMTFWAAGYRNVTCTFGTNGFTDELAAALARHATKRVLIAFDRDAAGDTAAGSVAERLMARGIDCYRILFPHGLDANTYALASRPADKSLGIAIRKAAWLGNGTPPARPGAAAPASGSSVAAAPASGLAEGPRAAAREPDPRMASELPGQLSLFAAGLLDLAPPVAPPSTPTTTAAKEEASPLAAPVALPAPSKEPETPATPPASEPTPPLASPLPPPPSPPPATSIDTTTDSITFARGERLYRVRGLAANTSFAALRINLRVRADAGFHVDTLDLLQARQRAAFEKAAALELGVAEDLIHHDLAALLGALDELQDSAVKKALEPRAAAPSMTDQERADALTFLRDPHLVDHLLADFVTAGCVGEETNKLVGYLATVSRKLDRPLALIVQSTSAAGKSTLMDAILDFVPPEDREQFSALTGQALFYMGETNLAHKILAIVEEEGAERASYALKILQSEGQLNIASTGKDPATGRLVTHEYKVQGPVMIFLTTTAIDLDEELQNRCLVLTVDENRSQTQRIHQLQRLEHTLNGLKAKAQRAAILKRHQNAQRLLAPLTVVNPFVDQLRFPDDKTRTRRDHAKFLNLIDAVALLHQHQRPSLSTPLADGSTLRYIQVTPEDLALAKRLADEVLGRSLDELPPQTRRFLGHLDALVTQGCAHSECDRRDFHFTRKAARDFTGWSDFQVRTHLDKLVSLEYLLVHRGCRGQSFVYELLYDGQGADGRRFVMGLAEPDTRSNASASGAAGFDYGEKFEGSPPEFETVPAKFEPSSSPQSAPIEPTSSIPESPLPAENPGDSRPDRAENANLGHIPEPMPYTKPAPRRRLPRVPTAVAAAAPVATAAVPAARRPGGNGSSHPKAAHR